MEAATAADLTLRYLVGYITLGSAAKGYVSDLTVAEKLCGCQQQCAPLIQKAIVERPGEMFAATLLSIRNLMIADMTVGIL